MHTMRMRTWAVRWRPISIKQRANGSYPERLVLFCVVECMSFSLLSLLFSYLISFASLLPFLHSSIIPCFFLFLLSFRASSLSTLTTTFSFFPHHMTAVHCPSTSPFSSSLSSPPNLFSYSPTSSHFTARHRRTMSLT